MIRWGLALGLGLAGLGSLGAGAVQQYQVSLRVEQVQECYRLGGASIQCKGPVTEVVGLQGTGTLSVVDTQITAWRVSVGPRLLARSDQVGGGRLTATLTTDATGTRRLRGVLAFTDTAPGGGVDHRVWFEAPPTLRRPASYPAPSFTTGPGRFLVESSDAGVRRIWAGSYTVTPSP